MLPLLRLSWLSGYLFYQSQKIELGRKKITKNDLFSSISFVVGMPANYYDVYRRKAAYEQVRDQRSILTKSWIKSYILSLFSLFTGCWLPINCISFLITRQESHSSLYLSYSEVIFNWIWFSFDYSTTLLQVGWSLTLSHTITTPPSNSPVSPSPPLPLHPFLTDNARILSNYPCLQIYTTRNMQPSPAIDWLWGGLNYQVRRTAPYVSFIWSLIFDLSLLYRLSIISFQRCLVTVSLRFDWTMKFRKRKKIKVMPRVKEFCKEHDIPYLVCFLSYFPLEEKLKCSEL